jgi:hypothetical protein
MSIQALPESIKKIFRPAYYLIQRKRMAVHSLLFKSRIEDYHQIPIIINNYNRLSFLLLLLSELEKRGYKNIYIIDNSSTFQPLLDYYSTCPYKVFRLKKNFGYLALWSAGIYKQFKNSYYAYTDSDVVPVEECPEDFLKIFQKKIESDPSIMKVGFSLKIDDLPDHYKLKKAVLENERQYFVKQDSDMFYVANIDTTFALYRQGFTGGANLYQKMYRSAYPYEARHMPWYTNSDDPGNEELFYLDSVQKSTHWSKMASNKPIQ